MVFVIVNSCKTSENQVRRHTDVIILSKTICERRSQGFLVNVTAGKALTPVMYVARYGATTSHTLVSLFFSLSNFVFRLLSTPY